MQKRWSWLTLILSIGKCHLLMRFLNQKKLKLLKECPLAAVIDLTEWYGKAKLMGNSQWGVLITYTLNLWSNWRDNHQAVLAFHRFGLPYGRWRYHLQQRFFCGELALKVCLLCWICARGKWWKSLSVLFTSRVLNWVLMHYGVVLLLRMFGANAQ